jgi:mono/diheme cytochrome c family protein
MRKFTNLVVLAAVLSLPLLLAAIPSRAEPAKVADAAAVAAGKSAFVSLNCSICHSIESQQIERKSKSEKTKGPDLSTIGTTAAGAAAHDVEWVGKFLRKEIANSDGKKHGKDFKGTPEQLEQLAAFLASLKTIEKSGS